MNGYEECEHENVTLDTNGRMLCLDCNYWSYHEAGKCVKQYKLKGFDANKNAIVEERTICPE